MRFQLINNATKERHGDFAFDNPKDAEATRKIEAEKHGISLCIKPLLDVAIDWKAREQARIDSGEYTLTPWHGDISHMSAGEQSCIGYVLGKAKEANHFLHMSKEHAGRVAFTESEEKGLQDRQLTLSPTKYLARVLNGMYSEQIRASLAAMCGEKSEFKTAKTADEIEAIYTRETSPYSCMKKKNYTSQCHPVRVYGRGDLQLAYLETDDQEVTARALIWPEKLKYGRVYGDAPRLELVLKEAGYRRAHLTGARIDAIKLEDDSSEYVMPYIDDTQSVRVGKSSCEHEKGYLIICEEGDWGSIDASSENGTSRDYQERNEEPEFDSYCERCDEGCDETWTVYTRSDRSREAYYCSGCLDSNTFRCDNTSDYYSDNCSTYEVDGETWCQQAVENNAFTSDLDGELHNADNMVILENGDCWSKAEFEDYGFECAITGDKHSKDDQEHIKINVMPSTQVIGESLEVMRRYGWQAHNLISETITTGKPETCEYVHSDHEDDLTVCSFTNSFILKSNAIRFHDGRCTWPEYFEVHPELHALPRYQFDNSEQQLDLLHPKPVKYVQAHTCAVNPNPLEQNMEGLHYDISTAPNRSRFYVLTIRNRFNKEVYSRWFADFSYAQSTAREFIHNHNLVPRLTATETIERDRAIAAMERGNHVYGIPPAYSLLDVDRAMTMDRGMAAMAWRGIEFRQVGQRILNDYGSTIISVDESHTIDTNAQTESDR